MLRAAQPTARAPALLEVLSIGGLHSHVLVHLSVPSLCRLRRCCSDFRDRDWVADGLSRQPRLALVGGVDAMLLVLDWQTMRWQVFPRLGSAALATQWQSSTARAAGMSAEELAERFYGTPKAAAAFFARDGCVAWMEPPPRGGIVCAGGTVSTYTRIGELDSAEFLSSSLLTQKCRQKFAPAAPASGDDSSGGGGSGGVGAGSSSASGGGGSSSVDGGGGGVSGNEQAGDFQWAALGVGLSSARSQAACVPLSGGGALLLGGNTENDDTENDDNDQGSFDRSVELASIERLVLAEDVAAGGGSEAATRRLVSRPLNATMLQPRVNFAAAVAADHVVAHCRSPAAPPGVGLSLAPAHVCAHGVQQQWRSVAVLV